MLDAAGSLRIAGGAAAPGAVVVEAGADLSGAGHLDGRIIDNGTISASGGLLALHGEVSGPGTVAITAHAALPASGDVGANLAFLPRGAERLELGDPLAVAGRIAGFAKGDTIELLGMVASGVTFAPATDILTVKGSVHGISHGATLHFGAGLSQASFGFKTLLGSTYITHT